MEISQILSELNAELSTNAATLKMTDIIRTNNSLTEDFVGKVQSVGFVELNLPATSEQKITIGTKNIVRAVGENLLSYSVKFETGETIAVNTLLRSNKSKIGPKPAKSYSPAELLGLVGKTLTLTSVQKDPSTARMNNVVRNGVSVREENIGKAYIFTIA